MMLPPRREHDFHKITDFTFSSNFDPKWDPKSKDFDQKRARGDPKITKMAEKSSFWKARFFTLFLVGLCTHFLLKKKYSGRVRRHARESGKGKGWDNPPPRTPISERKGRVPDVNCLRFASPAEATGGLEAWSLEAWKRLARGLEEACSTSWEWSLELKFHETCLPGEVLTAQATKVACKECQEEGKEGQGGPKDDKIDTPNGPKTSPRRLIWESWR